MMYSPFRDEVNHDHLAMIDAVFFAPHRDIVGHSMEFHATRIHDNRFVFSFWEGSPVAELEMLVHEMCHMVEIDDARCTIPGWALGTGKWTYIPGHGEVSEGMRTTKAIEREIRVMGFQVVLCKHYGFSYDTYELAKLMKWIDGIQFYYPPRRKRGKMSYTELEEYAVRHIQDRIEAQAQQVTMDQFRQEWARKMDLLRAHRDAGGWQDEDEE